MRPFITIFSVLLSMATGIVLTSCEAENYEKGEGTMSYTMAEYADVTVQNSVVTSILTDNNELLRPSSPLAYNGENGTDTVIRRLIYYSKEVLTGTISIDKTEEVAVLTPHDPSEIDVMKTDPVKLKSVWKSANERYVNMQLGIMAGNDVVPGQQQLIQFRLDNISTQGRGRMYVTLYHDQAGVPEYYTIDKRISLRMPEQDTLTVSVSTYDGMVTHTFIRGL